MKIWSFFMLVHEHAHEDKSAGYEQDSCAHAFAREIYEIKWVGKSANGHSWVELIHKLCKRMQKDRVFGVPASCKTPVPVCHVWPCAIAKGLPRTYFIHFRPSFFSTRSSLKFQKRKLSQFRMSHFKRHDRAQLPLGRMLFDDIFLDKR